MIHLDPPHRQFIERCLSRYPYQFCAFGSRVKGTHQPYSDLDLCCMDALPELTKAELDEIFEESDLPFRVDIVVWHQLTPDFQTLIKAQLVPLPTS